LPGWGRLPGKGVDPAFQIGAFRLVTSSRAAETALIRCREPGDTCCEKLGPLGWGWGLFKLLIAVVAGLLRDAQDRAGARQYRLLWLAIAGTTVAFRRVTMTAGFLLVPYLLWVGFAAALNSAVWRLNR